jgi:hypothetical protein
MFTNCANVPIPAVRNTGGVLLFPPNPPHSSSISSISSPFPIPTNPHPLLCQSRRLFILFFSIFSSHFWPSLSSKAQLHRRLRQCPPKASKQAPPPQNPVHFARRPSLSEEGPFFAGEFPGRQKNSLQIRFAPPLLHPRLEHLACPTATFLSSTSLKICS